MRICIISREYPPDSGWGGIATYSYHQAHGLVALGHEVEVISLAAAGAASHSAEPTIEDGIKVHRVKWQGLLDSVPMIKDSTPFSQYVLKSIFALTKKFLEVHAKNPFDVAEAPEHLAEGLGIALTRALPLVVRLHTPQSKFIAEKFHNVTATFDQQLVAIMERYAMLFSDAITSPSEDMADFVAGDINYPRNEMHVIRNPVDSEKFSPDGDKALSADGKLTVLFVGRLEARKGIHYLVEAVPQVVKNCPQVQFVIIGSDTNNAAGQGSVLHELKESLGKNGCAAHVVFIPHVPLADIPRYYRSADICVVPSLYDNAPCTCLEAMSSGKAVIGTSSGGTPEYVLHEKCGLIIKAKDSPALAGAIIDLAKNESKRLHMGAAGRQRVLENYTPQTIAKQSLDVYQLAIQEYKTSKVRALIPAQSLHMFDQDNELLSAYNQMLYNFLYLQSWDFRAKHRLKRAGSLVATLGRKTSSSK